MRRKWLAFTLDVSPALCLIWAWSRVAGYCWWAGTAPLPAANGYRSTVHWAVSCAEGQVYVERSFFQSRNNAFLAAVSASGSNSVARSPDVPTVFGFGFHRETGKHPLRNYELAYVVLPLWPLLLTGVRPLFRLVSRSVGRASPRTQRGLCRCCSYDLTGNASGVCPECGTPIPGKARVVA